MIRLIVLFAAIVATTPAAAQLAALDGPGRPALKHAATITGEIVRIGDLVENSGAVADVAIFRAPDLGQTGGVPASQVIEAVRPHHIIDLDTRGIGEVVVTRASRAITAKDFEIRLLGALAGQYGLGAARDLAITFDQQVRTLQVEPGATAELNVTRLSYEPRTRRFDVMFEVPGSTVARRTPLRFLGSVVETAEAVIPLRAIAQGEVMKASDVMIERRPKSELSGTPALAIEDVLEFAAKRALRPGQVIRASDVMKPELVVRNEPVTMVFEVPGMVLTMRGKALESGAEGDLINVINIQSKRTVQAVVVGPGRVAVSASSSRLAASENPQRKRAE